MNRLKFMAVLLIVAVLTGALTLAGSRAGQAPAAEPKSDQVQELLKRVEKLEARVAELEQRSPRVIIPAQGAPQLRVLPEGKLDGQPVPKNWIPREFNGQRYYDIPLETGSPRK